MKRILLVAIWMLAVETTWAIPQPSKGISGRGNWTMQKTIGALKLPAFNRRLLFENIDAKALENLETIVFSETYDMSVRWRAMTTIAVYGGQERVRIIGQAMNHNQWYVRNAALVSANHVNKNLGLRIARSLKDDAAMVVRAAAIETLAKNGEREDIEPLWEEINHQRNFRGGRGLWIRPKIAEALSKIAYKSDMGRIVPWLKDKDPQMKRVGVRTLEKLVGLSLGKQGDGVDARARYWVSWWGQRATY